MLDSRKREALDVVQSYYDHLANDYHLLFADWRETVRQQGRLLDELICSELGPGPHRILDCACGIGTQAIGLASRGHTVTGTDFAHSALTRADQEATRWGVKVNFRVADFRELDTQVPGVFDAVICCDNAVPHLATFGDLVRATRAMRSKLRPEGLLVVSIRDYDSLIESRPVVTVPRVYNHGNHRRVMFQLWDWLDQRFYTYSVILMIENSTGWNVRTHPGGQYRALTTHELTTALEKAGFQTIQWLPESGDEFHERTVIAREGPS